MRELTHREDGAVAILVAILTVVLVGIAAFSTDFGLAYANKRDLQKAADSAALAAASGVIRNLTSPTENCASVASRYAANTGGLRTTLQALADQAAASNNPRSTRVGMTVTCSADSKRVLVSYTNDGTTPSIFGGVFNADDLTARRTATADVFVRSEGFGLRPYALCILDANTLSSVFGGSPKWAKATFPNAACGNYSGNWYSLDCPADGNNGTLDENTEFGCASSVGVIPQFDSAGVGLPAGTINASIISECTDAADGGTVTPPSDCLKSNPGNLGGLAIQKWDYLMTLPAIVVPVFDPGWNDFASTAVGGNLCKTGGNNGCYPVRSLAAVKVCAYKFNNQTPAAVSSDPRCAGLTLTAVTGETEKNAVWFALTTPVQVSGSYGPGSGSIGDGSNVLGTRLVQ